MALPVMIRQLLDLFRYIDGYQNMSKFLELLRDNDRGRVYRTHACILDIL